MTVRDDLRPNIFDHDKHYKALISWMRRKRMTAHDLCTLFAEGSTVAHEIWKLYDVEGWPDHAKTYALASLPVGESTPLSELELRAIAFAAKAHSCQVDKAGHSYLAHPFRVAMAVRSEGEKYFAVGMLHDVPEDTDATLAEITAEFGPEIGEAVGSLTRRKATSSYESDVIRAMTNPIGRKVKQADVADNLRPERIGLLEPATQERLRKKYAIAHEVFKEVAELGLGESREPLPPK